MSELDFAFEHQGRIVRPGQMMHVAPAWHWCAGATGRVIRYYGKDVVLQHADGAVPTVPVEAISWEPHPETTAREELLAAGVVRPSARDVQIWMLAQKRIQSSAIGIEDEGIAILNNS